VLPDGRWEPACHTKEPVKPELTTVFNLGNKVIYIPGVVGIVLIRGDAVFFEDNRLA